MFKNPVADLNLLKQKAVGWKYGLDGLVIKFRGSKFNCKLKATSFETSMMQ